ncbi:MAG: hypothetical protein OXI77_15150 [Chloroflexota bacterium]|nr:hypothetical protein [Chloroflexota bacterium]MDE2909592.1 hypothetical protein [Chloroflexota bacterium]
MPRPKVIHQPTTQLSLKRGINTLVKAIAPTLGPTPRRSIAQNQTKFESLDDGGVIARRIIALPEPEIDVGAMLLRQVLWQAHQHVGDGVATTAVLYERIYKEGLRFIAAGADPMRLRARLMTLLPQISARLLAAARPLRGEAELKSLAFSVCYDEEMAKVLGEIIHSIGQYGQVDIRAGHGRGMEHNFVEGSYWRGGAQSKEMLRGFQRGVAEMHDAAIIVTDMDIEEPRDLVPLMSLALRHGISNLLLVVASISETGMSVVLDKRLTEQIRTVVVKIDAYHPADLSIAQDDIALLTGARPLLQKAGESLEHARADNFGEARWVWADDKNFGFACGKGDPRRLRAQVRSLRQAYAAAEEDDDQQRILERLGRLNGGLATVYVGGIAEDEIRQRKETAERTVRALRRATQLGVIPGGGIALLHCRDDLLKEAEAQPEMESRAARLIMAAAVEAPIRQLLTNAGYDPGEVLAQIALDGGAAGFDVMRDEIVDVAAAGILDVAQVQVEALQRAVSSAALALTIDVLVLHREPETMTDP